ncbi:MAG: endolytic transglycosylase MltG [Betaproteobacteria bacterium]
MILKRIAQILAVLLLLLAMVIAGFAWSLFTRPLQLPSSPYAFEVKSGMSLSAVARDLQGAGAIALAWPMIAMARLQGTDRSIKTGNYEVESGITLPQLLARLTQGDATQTSFAIIEGATFADVRRALKARGQVRNTVLDLPEGDLMARLGASGQGAEGRFFPDTYFFSDGSSDVALLRRAHDAMTQRLARAWESRAPGLPFASPDEALILASIVEKETGRAADRPMVASVFINRMKRGMRLQTDPTVIYGMGDDFDGNLRRRDLETDTPWNTYTRDGLPPTPISLPSQASLDAVLHPPPGEYLYFVARGDGTSQFSTNLTDHNRAVAKFQRGGR